MAADTIDYYFNAYNVAVAWTNDPEKMVDGTDASYAYTKTDLNKEELTGNNCPGSNLGEITDVQIRAYGYGDGGDSIDLVPVFAAGDGDIHNWVPGVGADWSAWISIFADTNKPDPWTWAAVQALDCDVIYIKAAKANELYIGEVQIRVTYTPPDLKKVSSVVRLSIKKVAGVTLANIKKVAGVSNV